MFLQNKSKKYKKQLLLKKFKEDTEAEGDEFVK